MWVWNKSIYAFMSGIDINDLYCTIKSGFNPQPAPYKTEEYLMCEEERKDEPVGTITEELLNRRTVTLIGQINDKLVDEVGRQLIFLQMRSPKRINLIINSGGGCTDSAFRLCDLITTVITAPVRGITLGACGSSATFVMLHCNERVSTPYARFMIHSGILREISVPINQTTSENLEHLLEHARATEKMVLELYMSKLTPTAWTKKEPSDEERREYVQKLIERGDQRFNDWLSAEEAVEAGLVTEIVRGKLDIFSSE